VIGLVTLSSDAVMLLLLPGAAVLEAVAFPLASIVKAFVLVDTHVAMSVIGYELPPLSTPVAVNCSGRPTPTSTVPVGLIVMDTKLGGTTLIVAVPVIEALWSAVAVTVILPTVLVEVTRPEVFMLAAIGPPLAGTIVQLTEALPVLPSLKLPVALICTVLLVGPASIVAVEGATDIEVNVGFTKNPRQLTARARAASAATAPATRSWCLIDDIFISDSLRAGWLEILAIVLSLKPSPEPSPDAASYVLG
jgi:hypothetical protein